MKSGLPEISFRNEHVWVENNPNLANTRTYQHRFPHMRSGIVGNLLIVPYPLPDVLTFVHYRVFLEQVLPGLFQSVPLITQIDMCFMHDRGPAGFSKVFSVAAWTSLSTDRSPLTSYWWQHEITDMGLTCGQRRRSGSQNRCCSRGYRRHEEHLKG